MSSEPVVDVIEHPQSESDEDDDEIDATEETAMVPHKTPEIVSRRSAEKRKSAEKPYSR